MCGRPPKFSPGCHGLPMEHYTHDSDRERRNFHLPWRVDDILDPDQWPLARSSSRGWPWPFSLWQLPLAFWFWPCLPPFPTHYLARGLSQAARLSWIAILHSTYPSLASPACPISRGPRVLRIKYFTVLRPRDVAFRYQSQSPDSPVPILERIIGLLSWHFLFLFDMNYFSSCPQYSIPTDLAFQSCLPMSSTKSHHCNHQHYFYLPTQVARQCPDRSLLYRSSSSVQWSHPGRIRRRPSYGDVGLLAMKNTPAPKISWTTMTRRHLKIQLLLVGLQITPLSMGQL
jgi:hypothetical protein